MRRWIYTNGKVDVIYAVKNDDSMIDDKHDITIEPGNYKLEESINMFEESEFLKNTRTRIKIDKHKLNVRIYSDWNIDFTQPNSLENVFGFKNTVLKAFQEHTSDFIPQIFDTNAIKIHCHLINTNISDERRNSSVIYSCPLDHSKIGTTIVKEPSTIMYYPVNTVHIISFRIDITDQNNKLIDFQGEQVLINLHCKPI